MSEEAKKPKSRPETYMLRVEKGALVPSDEATKDRLRDKGYRVGDVLTATLRKARSPEFHRFAHALGRLVAENVMAFEGLSAHQVLKRIMLEENIGCTTMWINFPGIGPCEYRIPQSISFDTLDDGEFKEIIDGIKHAIVRRYWPSLTEETIQQMADMMR